MGIKDWFGGDKKKNEFREKGKDAVSDGKLTAQAGASPEGVLSLRIEDTAEFMRLLAGAESLGPEDQKAMEFVTGLLGGQDGGPLTLDFTARDGGLWYGPFRLTDLPRLE